MTKRTLTSPGEGTGIETDGTVLDVSTTATHEVNALRTELGHGRLATHLELSLLDVNHDLSTGQATLMTRITANTYNVVSPCVIDGGNEETLARKHRITHCTYPYYTINCPRDSLLNRRHWSSRRAFSGSLISNSRPFCEANRAGRTNRAPGMKSFSRIHGGEDKGKHCTIDNLPGSRSDSRIGHNSTPHPHSSRLLASWQSTSNRS